MLLLSPAMDGNIAGFPTQLCSLIYRDLMCGQNTLLVVHEPLVFPVLVKLVSRGRKWAEHVYLIATGLKFFNVHREWNRLHALWSR